MSYGHKKLDMKSLTSVEFSIIGFFLSPLSQLNFSLFWLRAGRKWRFPLKFASLTLEFVLDVLNCFFRYTMYEIFCCIANYLREFDRLAS